MEERDKWGLNWEVWVNSKFTCAYCGFDGMMSVLTAHQLTVDHVRPRCRDGKDDRENLRAACSSCNSIKAEWDRSVYDPAYFESRTSDDVFLAAKNYVQEWYKKWDRGYTRMIEEASRRS